MARESVADSLSRQLATAIRWATRLEQELADLTDEHTTDAVYGVWSRRLGSSFAELRKAHDRIVHLEGDRDRLRSALRNIERVAVTTDDPDGEIVQLAADALVSSEVLGWRTP